MSGRAFWGTILLLLSALCLADFPTGAQDEAQYPQGSEGGQKLARDLRNMRLEDAHWKGELKIHRHGPQGRSTTVVPVFGQAVSGDTQWKMIYLTSAADSLPAEQVTVVHTLDSTNEYLYARAPSPGAPLGEPKVLSGDEANIPLAGSDFWLSDVGFEFFHWPGQELLKGQMRHGQACWVLESTNPNPKPGGYSRVVSFIDKNNGGPLQAEGYGADGKLLKEFALGKVKKVNGRWELKRMEISNDLTDSRTELEFDLDEKAAPDGQHPK